MWSSFCSLPDLQTITNSLSYTRHWSHTKKPQNYWGLRLWSLDNHRHHLILITNPQILLRPQESNTKLHKDKWGFTLFFPVSLLVLLQRYWEWGESSVSLIYHPRGYTQIPSQKYSGVPMNLIGSLYILYGGYGGSVGVLPAIEEAEQGELNL